MATGVAFRWWAIPIALLGWLLLWRGNFSIVEQGTAMLGLVAISFAVGALVLHPTWPTLGRALLPSLPSHDRARYWYLAVSILGASISPYLYLFYSAGAIEDEWTIEHLGVNRITAGFGNVFGGGLAIAALVTAALVFAPREIKVDRYEQIALLLATPLGRTGFVFFVMTLFVTCFGATLEIVLAMAYLLAQGFGWNWSENLKPGKDARFSTSYTVLILLAGLADRARDGSAEPHQHLDGGHGGEPARDGHSPVRADERRRHPIHAREWVAEQPGARRHRTALARAARRRAATAAARRWVMGAVQLSHEVIDTQLVDRHQEKIGRVDELLIELEDGKPPRVATIVIGGAARARRVGRWMVACHRAVHSAVRAA